MLHRMSLPPSEYVMAPSLYDIVTPTLLSQVVDTSNVNPDLIEAWRVTKAGVSGMTGINHMLVT